MSENPARLDLRFELRAGRTVLAARHVGYPFHVTAPLRRGNPAAEIFVQSVAGGIFAGDCLAQRIEIDDGAAAIIRMPSAAVVHAQRSPGAARQNISLTVRPRARLFYLPRPLILLPGSALEQSTEITLAPGGTLLLQDGFLVHDPHGTAPAARTLDSRISIRRSTGRLIALDRMRVTDETINAACPGVTGACRAFGTVWLLREATPGCHDQLHAVLAKIFAAHPADMAITRLRDDAGVLIRIAARDGGDLDTALTAIQDALLALPWLTPTACAPPPPP